MNIFYVINKVHVLIQLCLFYLIFTFRMLFQILGIMELVQLLVLRFLARFVGMF